MADIPVTVTMQVPETICTMTDPVEVLTTMRSPAVVMVGPQHVQAMPIGQLTGEIPEGTMLMLVLL